jgi:hypothetical protein
MKKTNQVFLQLREANRYASSKNPLQRRWAVIMLDNIVELQLVKMFERELRWDFTTPWGGVRQYSDAVRDKTSFRRGELHKFAQKQGWISQDDNHLLRYACRVRNAFYHQGRSDEDDAELTIRLLYRSIEKYFPRWRVTASIIQISTSDPVLLSAADDDASANAPILVGCEGKNHRGNNASGKIQSEEYWTKALRRILTYRPRENIRRLIKTKVTKILDDMSDRLASIDESRNLDFTAVAARRFNVFSPIFGQIWAEGKRLSVAGALNIYMAVLKDEEKLLDIPDPVERAKAFDKLVADHGFVSNAAMRKKITNCRRQAQRILKKNAGEGVAEFLRLETELTTMAEAIREISWDLDNYINMLIAERRGN